ncbi:helix-turn-helix domain-containing protein [Limosilactobacillus mucosae]|uniref:helix-turn-helix domain-containing protein n=1 Tax=Limosilactobacillus mucosae TaxID=97478 RepID=UPI0022E1FD9A|nr:helix-turn-helix transcriptional regulator [Limosilactobacillus mucosae]
MDTATMILVLAVIAINGYWVLDAILRIKKSLENQAKKLGRDQAIKDYFLDTPRKSQSPYKEGTGGLIMWEIIEVHLMEQNMKPIELAEKAGISTGTLSDLKSGRLKYPSFNLLEKIADVLNIDMNEFRGLS